MVERRQSQSQAVTFGEAYSYIESVKEAFHSEPAKYKEFLSILKDYQADRADVDTTIVRVTELLKEHGKLYLGFRVFLTPESEELIPPDDAKPTILPQEEPTISPVVKRTIPLVAKRTIDLEAEPTISPEAKMTIPPKAKPTIRIISLMDDPTIPPENKRRSDSVKFMNKLKERFRRLDRHIVPSYHNLMRSFKEGNKSERELHKAVIQLLYYHDDLIDDFFGFASTRKIIWRQEYLDCYNAGNRE